MKLGVDPTSPDIHLGHTVVLRNSASSRTSATCGPHHRRLHRAHRRPVGKKGTGPLTGRRSTRTQRSTRADRKGRRRPKLELVRNGTGSEAQLPGDHRAGREAHRRADPGREDFTKRHKEARRSASTSSSTRSCRRTTPFIMYADVSWGTDQTFNLLAGGSCRRVGRRQIALTCRSCVDRRREQDVEEPGNHVGVHDAPEMFGKTMSVPKLLEGGTRC